MIPQPERAVLLVAGERVRIPPQGRKQFLVESKSQPGTDHIVETDDADGLWKCSCEGFGFRGNCRHQRAIQSWQEGLIDAKLEGE